ncbi:sodium:calcium antiporter, partial [Rhodospirillales bacterium]|nr:sodium:calcium antiporter [Rhodospirillales bacterium]
SYSFYREKGRVNTTKQQLNSVADEIDSAPNSLVKIILYLIIGFTGLIFGSDLLVTGGVGVARVFGISEAVIGLTIVAFGTSLPELAATAVAAYRKHSDVALGNLVGSNIFNIIGIVGVVSLISPMEVPERIIEIDLWVMLAATLILMPFMIGNKKVFSRTGASLFLLFYIFYIGAVGYGIGNFN